MAVEGAVAVHPEETTEGLESLGVEPVEVRDPVGRNIVIAVVGLVLVLAALVPLVYGAVWAGSVLYAAVITFLMGGPPAPEGAAI